MYQNSSTLKATTEKRFYEKSQPGSLFLVKCEFERFLYECLVAVTGRLVGLWD